MNNMTALELETDEKETQRKVISALITFGILGIFVCGLFFLSIHYFDPPPPEEGAMVDMEGGAAPAMGQPDAGMNSDHAPKGTPEEAASAPATPEDPATQDYEEAPTAKKVDPNKTPAQTTTTTDNPKPKKPKRTLNPDYGLNTNHDGDGPGAGTGGKPGDQGQPNGTGDDPLGTGYGKSGIGDYYMGNNRKPERIITATCKFQRNFNIVVKIKVDRSGNVTSAECVTKFKNFNASGVDDAYCDCAKIAAKTVKFTPKPDAPASQEGAIKFEFKVK